MSKRLPLILQILIFLATIHALPSFAKDITVEVKDLMDVGKIHYESQEFDQAYKKFQQAFRLATDNPEVNYHLGLASVAIGDLEGAIMAFERVLIVDPNLTQAKIELGKTFIQLGAAATARQYIEEAMEADDLPPDVRTNLQALLNSLQ